MNDILVIHKKILDMFNKNKHNLETLIDNYNNILDIDNMNIMNISQDLKKKIDSIENNTELNYYLLESTFILDKYKSILKKPKKISFTGAIETNDEEKNSLIKSYLSIAEKYINIDEFFKDDDKKNSKINKSSLETNIKCNNCENNSDFDIIDLETYICLHCSSEQVIPIHNSSYKDSDRINITSKYIYDRKTHFRDAVAQYQGKQNCSIDQKVFDDLEREFENHYLLLGDKNTPRDIRYSRISKQTILLFLKDLKYTKHYENINLIHYRITNKKPDDISYLENKLIEDFDKLTELYDEMYKDINRKNFINTQYVLYLLLCRHKHPCNKRDFSILKTVDRKTFHDEISKTLFNKLGWNWQSPSF